MFSKIAALLCAAVLLVACGTTPADTRVVPPTEPTATPVVETTSDRSATYTLEDVAAHSTKDDCWLSIDGAVYNVTDFVARHPGGDRILDGCGKDATFLFKAQGEHGGSRAQSLLPTLQIGVLIQK